MASFFRSVGARIFGIKARGLTAPIVRQGADEKPVATLYASALAGFAMVAERLEPLTAAALLDAYLGEMSAPIRERHGIVDKYAGAGISAFWVPPFAVADSQAVLACAAALEQVARLEAFRRRVPEIIGPQREAPDLRVQVGIATGEVVVGDTVNWGAWLESANATYGTQLLIDGATRDMAGAAIEAREIDLVGVAGRDEPIRIYELAALAGWLGEYQRALFDIYATGLARYRAGDWDGADRAFGGALALAPDDGPSTTMLQRIAQLRKHPPGAWDGTWRLTSK